MGFWEKAWFWTKTIGECAIEMALAPSAEDREVTEAIEKEKADRERRRKEQEEADRKEKELLATMTPEEKRLYLLEKEVKELKSDNRSLRRRLNNVENECESQQNTIRDLESRDDG